MAHRSGSRPSTGGRVLLPSNFQMFAESMLVGMIICLLSLPLVTVVAGLTAGIGHLNRHTRLRSDSFSELWGDFVQTLRRHWPLGVAFLLVMALMGWNLSVLGGSPIPGREWMAAVMLLLMALLAVLALRTSAVLALAGGVTSKQALVRGLEVTREDPAGTVLLLVGLGMCVVFTWMLIPLAVLAPGLMAFATLAVESRRLNTSA